MQKEWRVEDGVYVRQLKERIRIVSRMVESDTRETLEQALSYIRRLARPPR